jgi:hypothetical protein
MAPRRADYYFLVAGCSSGDGLRLASRMNAIAPQISAPNIPAPTNSVTMVFRKSGDQ